MESMSDAWRLLLVLSSTRSLMDTYTSAAKYAPSFEKLRSALQASMDELTAIVTAANLPYNDHPLTDGHAGRSENDR